MVESKKCKLENGTANGNSMVEFFDLRPPVTSAKDEILEGLRRHNRIIHSKYHYDQRGSELCEQIHDQPEYYLTRTEMQIFGDSAEDISKELGDDIIFIEPGSGSCYKAMELMKTLKVAQFVPMDISKEFVFEAANEVSKRYPHMQVTAVANDHAKAFQIPKSVPEQKRVIFYPGSSVGNYNPKDSLKLLQSFHSQLCGGKLLIGVDMKKDGQVIHDAYNDKAGVIRAWTINCMAHATRLIGAECDLSAFDRSHFYNERMGRLEWYLRCLKSTQLKPKNEAPIDIDKDQYIKVGDSYKYSIAEFTRHAEKAGFKLQKCWTDPKSFFCVYLFQSE